MRNNGTAAHKLPPPCCPDIYGHYHGDQAAALGAGERRLPGLGHIPMFIMLSLSGLKNSQS